MSAVFSPCRKYRYELTRELGGMFGEDAPLVVIGLNPSTADEQKDDPTIRRCKKLAERLGCARLVMLNLFAYRATKPEAMMAENDPVGTDADVFLAKWAKTAGVTLLAAWGNHGAHKGRAAQVVKLLGEAGAKVHCLRYNADGSPQHPLYVPGNESLKPYPKPCS